ncbi:GntR family transcriptional regulator [Streptomyces sp. NPDC048272]|uniref:GntR family transcriptional regulator n=1 Tax=Streptomyces sp. NPDC048272 TaxID=3154616 RepID=UPI00342FA6BD
MPRRAIARDGYGECEARHDNAFREGKRVPEHASPRGTFLKIADAVKTAIRTEPDSRELPRVADLMAEHRVSRGVVLRAFKVLEAEGLAEPAPGGRWRVVRAGEGMDRRPLHERLVGLITAKGLTVGAEFPSASKLASDFGVARPTVAKALDKLEAAGLLSAGQQGKPRTVKALPGQERGF